MRTNQPATRFRARAGALSELLPFGPAIVEHVLSLAGLQGGRSPRGAPLTTDERSALLGAVRQLETWFTSLDTTLPEGVITTVPAGASGGGRKGKQAAAPAGAGSVGADGTTAGGEAGGAAAAEAPVHYQDFHPLVMAHLKDAPMKTFPTFDAALDEFFSKIAGQRAQTARMDVSCGIKPLAS